MRLFVAVLPAAPARDALAAALDRARRRHAQAARGVRWTPPANLHLTLRFLGETGADRAAAVAAALGAARGRPPFRAALDRAVLFPAQGPPRVLWFGLREGGAQLAALQEAVEARLAALGYRPDRRPYRAHLTVGRVRPAAPATRRELDALLAAAGPPPVAWRVDRVVLMESLLSPRGSTYRVVAEAPLGAGPRPAPEGRGAPC